MKQLFSDITQWEAQEMIPHRRKTNEVIPRIVLALCLEELPIHYEVTQAEHSILVEVRT